MDGTVSGLPGVEYICRRTGGGKACRNQHRQPAEFPDCGTDAAVQSGNDRSGAFLTTGIGELDRVLGWRNRTGFTGAGGR